MEKIASLLTSLQRIKYDLKPRVLISTSVPFHCFYLIISDLKGYCFDCRTAKL